jgi:N-acetylglucosamine-6-phosphate deacetylase
VRLITISPEWPQTPKYIEHVTGEGVVISIGHTKATAEQIQAAVSAGATMSTHLGNGAHQMILRHPNYIWDQMADDRLTAGFIVDGIHLGAAFLKCAVRAKTPARSLLVTDASMPACASPGIYKLGEQEVELTPDDRVVLRGTTRLAGSALRMDRAIGNLMRMTGTSLPESLAMVTRNPARIGRIAGRQRGLAPGDRADLAVFKYDKAANRVDIVQTIVDGEVVFTGNSPRN